ncbi:zinc-dependent alcohol dehydrogenase family protein [Streptosporangium subroseum]|uniref:zinc-dependent alcohol dehydrogenase family protein n=1 Tax=Streptosporangium subroseum TaxID=106412 RepID=UPI0034241C22
MKAIVYDGFRRPPTLREVPDPVCPPHAAVIRVEATGVCRSDWHGWMGHDPAISELPHVPGHEFAGTVERVGADVRGWRAGDRVTAPFVCACGICERCLVGDHQVCDDEFQPGFTHWGSFAEQVAVAHAEVNLVPLPQEVSMVAAASLGCRFATAFRAVTAQGRLASGEWVAVHGCGGVGLSAIMVAAAYGARVVAVDVSPAALEAAKRFGAEATVDATSEEVAPAVREAASGGAHLSIDAIGSAATCLNSIGSLRKRGRHVQVGLMIGDQAHPPIPMDRVIAQELLIVGSRGMAAHAYPAMVDRVADGTLRPDLLVGRTVPLDEAAPELAAMDRPVAAGMTVITL